MRDHQRCENRPRVPLAVLAGGLALLAGGALAFAGGPDYSPDRRDYLTESEVEDLVELVPEANLAAIVLFLPAEVEGMIYDEDGNPTGQRETVVAMGWSSTTDEEVAKTGHVFNVKGEFRLVKTLFGRCPPLGKVDESLKGLPSPLRMFRSSDPRPLDTPLWDFVTAWFGLPRPGPKDRLFIVTSRKPATRIFDCTFIGPLGEQDILHVEGLVKALKAGKGEAPAEEARPLLVSENPALAMLGLIRLAQLNQATGKDYAVVLKRVPLDYTECLFALGLKRTFLFETKAGEFADGVRDVYQGADKDRQAEILRLVRKCMESKSGLEEKIRPLFRTRFPEIVVPETKEPSSATPAPTSVPAAKPSGDSEGVPVT